MSLHFETLQIHAGYTPDPVTGSCAVPIYQTAAYAFKNADHAADLFDLKVPGHIYSRISNPTVEVFEKRLAALEKGTSALAVSSGHAAQFIALTNMLLPGDNLVTSPYLYGGTITQFRHTFSRLGIDIRFASSDNPGDLADRIDSDTKGIYIETISNPGFLVPDFEAVAKLAAQHNIPLIVDNTFAGGGYLFRPIEWGAHVVVESATKWINGHGTAIAGVIVDGGNYRWDNGKFPQLSEPEEAYHGVRFFESFGDQAFVTRCRTIGLRDMGSSLSPFDAFLLLQGLETLSLRMERHCQNALALAQWLELHPKVEQVGYPGLSSQPSHNTAKKYLRGGFGGVLGFRVKADREQARHLVEKFELVSHLANVGDSRTLILQPAATTHRQLSEKDLLAAGVHPSMFRVSVGLENIDDLIYDFNQALQSL